MRIRTTPALATAVLAAVIAVAGCSSAHPAASASTALAQSASTAPAQSSTSFTMPNEVGHVLQDAQDDLCTGRVAESCEFFEGMFRVDPSRAARYQADECRPLHQHGTPCAH